MRRGRVAKRPRSPPKNKKRDARSSSSSSSNSSSSRSSSSSSTSSSGSSSRSRRPVRARSPAAVSTAVAVAATSGRPTGAQNAKKMTEVAKRCSAVAADAIAEQNRRIQEDLTRRELDCNRDRQSHNRRVDKVCSKLSVAFPSLATRTVNETKHLWCNACEKEVGLKSSNIGRHFAKHCSGQRKVSVPSPSPSATPPAVVVAPTVERDVLWAQACCVAGLSPAKLRVALTFCSQHRLIQATVPSLENVAARNFGAVGDLHRSSLQTRLQADVEQFPLVVSADGGQSASRRRNLLAACVSVGGRCYALRPGYMTVGESATSANYTKLMIDSLRDLSETQNYRVWLLLCDRGRAITMMRAVAESPIYVGGPPIILPCVGHVFKCPTDRAKTATLEAFPVCEEVVRLWSHVDHVAREPLNELFEPDSEP